MPPGRRACPHLTPEGDIDDQDAAVRTELATIFLRHMQVFSISAIVLTGVLAVVSWRAVDHAAVLSWVGVIAVLLAAHGVVVGPARWRFVPAHPEQRARAASLLACKIGLLVGLAAAAWFPLLTVDERLIVTIALFTWGAGSLAMSMARVGGTLVFCLCLLGPLAAAWALHGGSNGLLVATLVVLVWSFVLVGSRHATSAIRDSVQAHLREADLSRRLERRGREMESAVHAKTHFLAAASHDLRQPVTSINLMLSALGAAPDLPTARAIARRLETPVQALDQILSSLLEMSRLEAGLVQAHSRPCDVRELLLAIQVEYTPLASSKKLTIRGESEPLVVMTDPYLLQRIIRNLVDNSLKFTSTGGIRLRAAARGGWLEIAVQDTGSGIAPELQDRVFDDYFQAGNPQRDRRKGLGLGLAIARRLVALLGGEIGLESVPGQGTTLRVRLPLQDAPGGAPESRYANAARPVDFPVQQVLLVEDDPLVREAFAQMLAPRGVALRAAAGVGEALSMLDAGGELPQLAIIDYRLPGDRNGLWLARHLSGYQPPITVLIVTGDTAPEILVQAEQAGVEVLYKPFTATQLTEAIGRAAVRGRAPATSPEAPGDRRP